MACTPRNAWTGTGRALGRKIGTEYQLLLLVFEDDGSKEMGPAACKELVEHPLVVRLSH
jgi:hypothetical protein